MCHRNVTSVGDDKFYETVPRLVSSPASGSQDTIVDFIFERERKPLWKVGG